MKKEELINLLEQYSNMQREVKKLEKRLDRLNEQTSMVSDIVQNGHKRHAIIYGVDVVRDYKINKLEEILKNRYNKLLEYQISLEEFLDTQKSDIRQILECRYIENMNWIQIQVAMRIQT